MNGWTAAVVVGVVAGGACAADTVNLNKVSGTTNGGAFQAVTGQRGTFQTFCVERNEYVHNPSWYDISDSAKFGGVGGGNPDPISDTTKALYFAFRQGWVGGQLSTANANVIADALQVAIWYEENELTTAEYNSYISGGNRADELLSWVPGTLSGAWAGANNVRVMNVWKHATLRTEQYAAQDQLIIIPLPSGAGMAFTGLLGLVAVRRRR
ncbi:MAG: VPLPA-CTERM sorting domain-containing protein [Phycisphaerales bacterium JB041]